MVNKKFEEKKLLGKIYNFDGMTGYVITPEDRYLIIPSSSEKLNLDNNDVVSFYPDSFKWDESLTKIARNISIVKKAEKIQKKN